MQEAQELDAPKRIANEFYQAHINGRLYPYSNVAGTLNLPSQLVQNVTALRKALAREH